MDDRGSYHGFVEPATGRRRLVARPAAGEPYDLRVAGAPAWGYEGEAPRQTASSLLLDLTGHVALGEQIWDLVAERLGDAHAFPPRGAWWLTAADLDAWRRGWFERPERRGLVERSFVGSLLRAPAAVEVDLALIADRRDRELAARILDGVRDGRAPDLDELQEAVEALRLGAEPGFVARRLRAAPGGPGPHVWAARLRAAAAARA